MTDKEKCIKFHKWVQSLHKHGFPKVTVMQSAWYKSSGLSVTQRDMTIDELYDHYETLTETQKRGFID